MKCLLARPRVTNLGERDHCNDTRFQNVAQNSEACLPVTLGMFQCFPYQLRLLQYADLLEACCSSWQFATYAQKADPLNMAAIGNLILSCPGEEYRAKHVPPRGTLDISEVLNNVLRIHYAPEHLFLHALHPRIHLSIFVRNLLLLFPTKIK